MIHSVRIKNFQSHKNSFLKFKRGVNVIYGKTDSGKSAVKRAIEWVIKNKPQGNSFRSHWGEETEVKLTVENKDKKTSIVRKKGKENLYFLNSKKYKSFGQNVPHDIQDTLRMSSINLQPQISLPFLLTLSAGETARFLNKIVCLDDIDVSLSNIQSIKKKETQKIEDQRANRNQFSFDLKSYIWIDKFDKKLNFLEKLQFQISSFKDEIYKINTIIEKIMIVQSKLNSCMNLNISKLNINVLAVEKEYRELKIKEIFRENLNRIIEDIKLTEERIFTIKNEKRNHEKQFKKLFPSICPLCERDIR